MKIIRNIVLSSETGAANLLAIECENCEIDNIEVSFLNVVDNIGIRGSIVNITWFSVDKKDQHNKEKKYGVIGMKFITDMASQHGIHLVLKPIYQGEKEDYNIYRFYNKCGFIKINNGEMYKKPYGEPDLRSPSKDIKKDSFSNLVEKIFNYFTI